MKRRTFLYSASGLILWRSWPATTPIQSTIHDFEDGGFLVEAGCLRCCLYPDSPSGSILDFVPWFLDTPIPEIYCEWRMAPTELLQTKLAAVGFPSRLEGDEKYPSLVARMTRIVTPIEVAERLEQVLRGGDWRLLYHDPNPNQTRYDLMKLF